MAPTQRPYWDQAALDRKVFGHPLEESWLLLHVPPPARVLDYGCGYGRLIAALKPLGYDNVLGVDFSPAMVARAREVSPDTQVAVFDGTTLPVASGSFDLVLLVAVLTCIPDLKSCVALMAEVRRVLAPAGLVFFSDLPLQDDGSHRSRYEKGLADGPWGTFTTSDGALVRHFSNAEFDLLFDGFDRLEDRKVAVHTMNGTPVTARQVMLKRGTSGLR